MVAHMLATHRLDPARVFVTGLSAGGAMAAVMLATHPEVFAAGAIIAGLPYGAAASMQEAFEAMASGRPRTAIAWAAQVRAAAPHHSGPWPRVSIWQGEADTTVRPVNAGELLKQWTALHGLSGAPSRVEAAPGGAPAAASGATPRGGRWWSTMPCPASPTRCRSTRGMDRSAAARRCPTSSTPGSPRRTGSRRSSASPRRPR
jgi:poly(3-hydroxybutyrate) depolymerase